MIAFGTPKFFCTESSICPTIFSMPCLSLLPIASANGFTLSCKSPKVFLNGPGLNPCKSVLNIFCKDLLLSLLPPPKTMTSMSGASFSSKSFITSAFDNVLLPFLDKCVDSCVSFSSMSLTGLCFANGRFRYASHSDPFAVSNGASINFSRDGQNIAPAVSSTSDLGVLPTEYAGSFSTNFCASLKLSKSFMGNPASSKAVKLCFGVFGPVIFGANSLSLPITFGASFFTMPPPTYSCGFFLMYLTMSSCVAFFARPPFSYL